MTKEKFQCTDCGTCFENPFVVDGEEFMEYVCTQCGSRNITKYLPEFDEETVLRALNKNLTDAMNKANERFENEPDADFAYFSIVINEVVHTFILGGTQMAGLHKFIEQVSEENGYDVVSEHLSPEELKAKFYENYEDEWDWAHQTWDKGRLLYWFLRKEAIDYVWLLAYPNVRPWHISEIPSEPRERYINYLKHWTADSREIPVEELVYGLDEALAEFEEYGLTYK